MKADQWFGRMFSLAPLRINQTGGSPMVIEFRPRVHKRWDEAADNQLRAMAAEGNLLPNIALDMGRTQEACRSRANVLKISIASTERGRRNAASQQPKKVNVLPGAAP